jgi:uncharacterized coiled-coil DUF342 family protein
LQAKVEELENALQTEKEQAAKAKEMSDKMRKERNEANAAEVAAKVAQEGAEQEVRRLESELERNRQLQRTVAAESKKTAEHLRSLLECVSEPHSRA